MRMGCGAGWVKESGGMRGARLPQGVLLGALCCGGSVSVSRTLCPHIPDSAGIQNKRRPFPGAEGRLRLCGVWGVWSPRLSCLCHVTTVQLRQLATSKD